MKPELSKDHKQSEPTRVRVEVNTGTICLRDTERPVSPLVDRPSQSQSVPVTADPRNRNDERI